MNWDQDKTQQDIHTASSLEIPMDDISVVDVDHAMDHIEEQASDHILQVEIISQKNNIKQRCHWLIGHPVLSPS